MLLVSCYNVEGGRNIPLSLRSRAAGDAVDSGNTFRTGLKTKEKKKRNGALGTERGQTERRTDRS